MSNDTWQVELKTPLRRAQIKADDLTTLTFRHATVKDLYYGKCDAISEAIASATVKGQAGLEQRLVFIPQQHGPLFRDLMVSLSCDGLVNGEIDWMAAGDFAGVGLVMLKIFFLDPLGEGGLLAQKHLESEQVASNESGS